MSSTDVPEVVLLGSCKAARPQPGRRPDQEADDAEASVLTANLFHLAAQGHQVTRHRSRLARRCLPPTCSTPPPRNSSWPTTAPATTRSSP
jgi:hypothetical protein